MKLIPTWLWLAAIGALLVGLLGQCVQVNNAKARVARADQALAEYRLSVSETTRILQASEDRNAANRLPVSHFPADEAQHIFDIAVHQLKIEGLVAKRADSVYKPGVRSSDWVKVKRNGAVPAERFRREAR